ncbi:MAG TPA: response regulator, partial [Gemmataceae bacterium]|nr:response regulator [Gemmataceae bacterium]
MGEGTAAEKTILVVEDDEITREGMAVVLTREGYKVVGVGSGREAVSSLRRGLDPCLILLDMMLPDMDGWQFMQARMRDAALAGIPVVVTTALGVSSPEWATSLGAVGFLRKPFDIEVLAQEVKRWC